MTTEQNWTNVNRDQYDRLGPTYIQEEILQNYTQTGTQIKQTTIPIEENLVEIRKRQYETLRKLCDFKDRITGNVGPATAEQSEDREMTGLIQITAAIHRQGEAIDELVEECRRLIGL